MFFICCLVSHYFMFLLNILICNCVDFFSLVFDLLFSYMVLLFNLHLFSFCLYFLCCVFFFLWFWFVVVFIFCSFALSVKGFIPIYSMWSQHHTMALQNLRCIMTCSIVFWSTMIFPDSCVLILKSGLFYPCPNTVQYNSWCYCFVSRAVQLTCLNFLLRGNHFTFIWTCSHHFILLR